MGVPPSLKSEFTTGFPTSKYMYKLVLTLSETFTRRLHEALFTPTAGRAGGRSHLVQRAVQAPSMAVGDISVTSRDILVTVR